MSFLFGGMTREQAGNPHPLSKRDEDAPLRNASFGNFTEHCRNINLLTGNGDSDEFDLALTAEYKDEQGKFEEAAMILDSLIVNDTGTLRWQSGDGFGGSVQNCDIDVGLYTVLTCDVGGGRDSFRKAAINLDAEIMNTNGRLTVNI